MSELLEYLARQLVDRPDAVSVTAEERDDAIVYRLHVAPEDVGKVIGRDGRTINALRTLLAVTAQRKGVKARLEILDDRRQAQAPASAASPAPPAAPPATGEP